MQAGSKVPLKVVGSWGRGLAVTPKAVLPRSYGRCQEDSGHR